LEQRLVLDARDLAAFLYPQTFTAGLERYDLDLDARKVRFGAVIVLVHAKLGVQHLPGNSLALALEKIRSFHHRGDLLQRGAL
jgi:hypothetical protein